MATGDLDDIVSRLKKVLPKSWFRSNMSEVDNPVLSATLAMPAVIGAWLYGLVVFTGNQTRLSSASGIFLDLLAYDFFGNNLVRKINQKDDQFRTRLSAEILRQRSTRPAIRKLLVDLTGREPVIFEPRRPGDTGAYGGSVRTPATGLGGLSVDATSFSPDTRFGASKGVNMSRLGTSIEPNGSTIVLYKATAVPQSYVQRDKKYGANKRYRVTCTVKKISGSGVLGDVISAAYHNGTSVVRMAAKTTEVKGYDLVEISVEFTNMVAGTYPIYMLGGTVDGVWGLYNLVVTEVVPGAGYPSIKALYPGRGYNVAGKYGSLSLPPRHAFIDVYRGTFYGATQVSGYGSPAGGYRVGRLQWSDLGSIGGDLTDDDIEESLLANKASGITLWVRMHS